jgi:hypothetical protein
MDAESTPMEVESPPRADLYTTLVRVVSGGIGEGIDRLLQVSAELDEASVEPDGDLKPFVADANVMAAIGWVSELPDLVAGMGSSAYRMTYPVARAAGVVVDTGVFVAQATGVASFVEGFTAPVREALAEERERLTAVGTAEYARGRVLAVHAFEQSVEGIVGLLSESEELGELVREQTLGVTGSAVQEIRETGAAADGLTEGIFRRIFRREDRPLPPKPSPRTVSDG